MGVCVVFQIDYIHERRSEVEGISTGPLAEILNYTTGITFEGFNAAESKLFTTSSMSHMSLINSLSHGHTVWSQCKKIQISSDKCHSIVRYRSISLKCLS